MAQKWTPPPFLLKNKQEEDEFQEWYRDRATKLNLDPNPDAPEHYYDYRAAHKAGAEPDNDAHWPSEYKREGHPNMIVNGMNTKTGQPASKKWEPPPFTLRKSKEQEEAEKPVDMTPGKWQPPPGISLPSQFENKPAFDKDLALKDLNNQEAQDRAEKASESWLGKAYRWGDKSVFEHLGVPEPYRPQSLYKRATEGIKEYGESPDKPEDSWLRKSAKKGLRFEQAMGENFAGGLEHALNPINIALMGVAGASSAAYGGAKNLIASNLWNTPQKANAAAKLYQIAKALEYPGKAASVAQVTHGGYNVATGETAEEKIGGGIEAALGLVGSRYRNKTRVYPETAPKNVGGSSTTGPVNTKVQHGPQEQLKFPLRGNVNPLRDRNFASGPIGGKGTYEQGTTIPGELGDVPAELAYDHGSIIFNRAGKPFVRAGNEPTPPTVDKGKLEIIGNYMRGLEDGSVPQGTTLAQFTASNSQQFSVTLPESIAELNTMISDAAIPVGSGSTVPNTMLPDVRQNQINQQLSDNPPIIDDAGGMDWIPEENQPAPVDPAKLQQFLGGVQGSVQPELDLPLQGTPEGQPLRDLPLQQTELKPFQQTPRPLVGQVVPPNQLPDVRQSISMTIPEPKFDRLGRPITEDYDAQEYDSELSQPTPEGIVTSGAVDPNLKQVGSSSTLPDVRQSQGQIGQIGDEIIQPSQPDDFPVSEMSAPENREVINPRSKNYPSKPGSNLGANEMNERIQVLDAQIETAYRTGNTNEVVRLSQDKEEIERALIGFRPGTNIHKRPGMDEIRDKEIGTTPARAFRSLPAEPEISEMRIPGTGNIAVGGADPEVLDMLATALYAKQDNPATVAKEGLQNSVDEMKISGKPGPIKIAYDWYTKHPVTGKHSRSLTVKDNGRGMTDEELYTIYTDVGKSGKRDTPEASGGFGFAKAAPLLSGEYVKVESITKLPNGVIAKFTFEGNPQQLKDQKVGVPVKYEEMPDGTETGFKVETFFPDKKYLSNAESLIRAIVSNSPGMDNVQVYSKSSSSTTEARELKDFLENPKSIYANKLLGGKILPLKVILRSANADLDLHYEFDNIERSTGKIAILNNGIFVKEIDKAYTWGQTLPGLPEKITVNIKPTIEEGKEGYPFGLNREEVQQSIINEINAYIEDNFIKPAKLQKQNEIQNVYDNLKPEPGNGYVVLDSGAKYTSAELSHINNSPSMNAISDVMHEMISDLAILMDSDTSFVTEKIGFRSADPGKGGSNISSNGPPAANGKRFTTILINPFDAILKGGINPKDAAARIVHITIHEFTHNIAREEGAGYTWALAQVYTKYDLQEQLNARRAVIKGITGKDGKYTPEVQKLLQEYVDSRGRTATQEDVLSRETESHDPESNRTSEITGGNKPDGDRATRRNDDEPHPPEVIAAAVGKLKIALAAGKLAREAQDELGHAERSRRAGMIAGVKTRGIEGYYQRTGMLSGALPKVETQSGISEADVSVLIDAISDSEILQPYSELSAERGLFTLLSGGAPQPSQSRLLSKVFGDPDLDGLIQMYGGVGLAGQMSKSEMARILFYTSKALKSSFDLSPALRQGLSFSFRKEWRAAFWDMHKALGSEKHYMAQQMAMEEHPDFDLAKQSVFLAEFGADPDLREDFMLAPNVDNWPGVKHSQRAYVTFLNQLRFNTFLSYMKDAKLADIPLYTIDEKFFKKTGIEKRKATPELLEIGKMINIFTGRGGLWRLQPIAKELNMVLWSPRNISSQITMLNPAYYYKASPFVQKKALSLLLSRASMGLGMLALAVAAGGEVEWEDSTSPDFLKAKFGDTRFDPHAGLQQEVVLSSRVRKYLQNAMIMLSGRPVPRNEKYKPGSGYGSQTARESIENFGENKTSPFGNFVGQMLNLGKSFEPDGLSIALTDDWNILPSNRLTKEVINLYSPMLADTLIDIAKENPGAIPATLLGTLSVYGSGTQTYKDRIPGGQYAPRPPRLRP